MSGPDTCVTAEETLGNDRLIHESSGLTAVKVAAVERLAAS